jgi:hypothetical protein
MDGPAMNTQRITFAASLCLYLLPVLAFADDYPPCDTGGNPAVALYGSKGVLSADAQGNPCYEAELEIRIDTHDGESIYKYKSELKQYTAIDWNDPDLDRYAKKIVSRVLKNIADSEESLPPRTSQDIKILADGYTLFKKKTGPTSTYYEGEITLQYDNKTETATIVMEAGF